MYDGRIYTTESFIISAYLDDWSGFPYISLNFILKAPLSKCVWNHTISDGHCKKSRWIYYIYIRVARKNIREHKSDREENTNHIQADASNILQQNTEITELARITFYAKPSSKWPPPTVKKQFSWNMLFLKFCRSWDLSEESFHQD